MKIVILIALIYYSSFTYGAGFPLVYNPEPSFPVLIGLSNKGVVANYTDETEQTLYDNTALREGHKIEDYNFDGYKDLAIFLGSDKRGLHSEYQFYYWNHVKKKLRKGKVFVNPQIENGFLIEYFYGYFHHKVRYKWIFPYQQMHSKLTLLEDDLTELIFFINGKAVKSQIVPSISAEKVLSPWDSNY